MQAVINYFAGLDKTTVKQFVTVVGIILFFTLTIVTVTLNATTDWDMTGWMIAMIATGAVTVVVGWEIFAVDE